MLSSIFFDREMRIAIWEAFRTDDIKTSSPVYLVVSGVSVHENRVADGVDEPEGEEKSGAEDRLTELPGDQNRRDQLIC